MALLLDRLFAHATLSNWLTLVAAMRLFAVALGYAYPRRLLGENLETQLFDGGRGFSPLAGRTFAVWTAATCAVSLAAAAEPENRGLLRAAHATFLLALGYFGLEVGVYGTVSRGKAARPAAIAAISALWTGHKLWKP
ncbi:hypothetical protein DFJ74DRAFT_143233 [Hyaloraphidium curvatum]|nr:hypothetical protein DFJ74DRAFT_143233 [Hyaloraphidium curvatum]